jgi:hypothetical protein
MKWRKDETTLSEGIWRGEEDVEDEEEKER